MRFPQAPCVAAARAAFGFVFWGGHAGTTRGGWTQEARGEGRWGSLKRGVYFCGLFSKPGKPAGGITDAPRGRGSRRGAARARARRAHERAEQGARGAEVPMAMVFFHRSDGRELEACGITDARGRGGARGTARARARARAGRSKARELPMAMVSFHCYDGHDRAGGVVTRAVRGGRLAATVVGRDGGLHAEVVPLPGGRGAWHIGTPAAAVRQLRASQPVYRAMTTSAGRHMTVGVYAL